MSIRIAIVEDNKPLRQIMSDWIGKASGLKLIQAYPDAETALVGLPKQPVDVVLMDINLPGQSGIECVRQLKPLMMTTQFVMVTVYMDTDLIFEALAAGATGYLLKRSTHEEILTAIREVHAGGSPMSRNIARMIVEKFQSVPSGMPDIERLSDREMDVLRLLSQGLFYKEIASKLNLSFNTVHTLSRRIYEKLQVNSRSEAVARFRLMPPSLK
jgi:DNA-binding NarL/FixJ family response regulator